MPAATRVSGRLGVASGRQRAAYRAPICCCTPPPASPCPHAAPAAASCLSRQPVAVHPRAAGVHPLPACVPPRLVQCPWCRMTASTLWCPSWAASCARPRWCPPSSGQSSRSFSTSLRVCGPAASLPGLPSCRPLGAPSRGGRGMHRPVGSGSDAVGGKHPAPHAPDQLPDGVQSAPPGQPSAAGEKPSQRAPHPCCLVRPPARQAAPSAARCARRCASWTWTSSSTPAPR